MTPLRWLRRVTAVMWALPTTSLGLLMMIAALLTRGRVRLVGGVLEVHGGVVAWGLAGLPLSRVAALTLGHVVLGTDAVALETTRPHERVHVAQCERWGPYFLPAYALSSLWALMRGGHPYHDNAFEREACARAAVTEPEPWTSRSSRAEL